MKKIDVIALYIIVVILSVTQLLSSIAIDNRIDEVSTKMEHQELVMSAMASILLRDMEDEKRVVEDSILNMEVPNIYIPNSEDPFWFPEIIISGGDA